MCVKPISFTYGTSRSRQLAIGQEAIALLGHARPRAEVHLVDRHRPLEPARPAPARAAIHSSSLPLVAAMSADDRRGQRRHLEREAERIGLQQHVAVARRGSRTCSARRPARPGMKISQTPLGAERAHRVHAAVPAVEVADDADAHRRSAPTRRSARRRRRRSSSDARRASRRCAVCVPSPNRCRSKSVRTRP